MNKTVKEDLIELYKLYLFALAERREYGEQYGDTKETIERYEERLGKNKPINDLLIRALRKKEEK